MLPHARVPAGRRRPGKSSRFVLTAHRGMSLAESLDGSSMTDLDQLEQLKSCGGPTFRELYEIYAASIAVREQKPEVYNCAMVRAPEFLVMMSNDNGRFEGFSILYLPPAERF